jgi:hypothetical protein
MYDGHLLHRPSCNFLLPYYLKYFLFEQWHFLR